MERRAFLALLPGSLLAAEAQGAVTAHDINAGARSFKRARIRTG
jgi:hypothetical protein